MADAQGRAKIPSVTRLEVETASRPPLESQDKPALTTGSQESRGETVGSDSKCREQTQHLIEKQIRAFEGNQQVLRDRLVVCCLS